MFSKGKKSETRGILNTLDYKVFDQVMFNFEDGEDNSNYAIYNIEAGYDHVLAIDDKHIVWGWGKNDNLQVSPKLKDKFLQVPVRISFVSLIKVSIIYVLI